MYLRQRSYAILNSLITIYKVISKTFWKFFNTFSIGSGQEAGRIQPKFWIRSGPDPKFVDSGHP